MSTATILSLPAAISLSGSEWAEIVQGGTSMRFQLSSLAQLLPAGMSVVSVAAGGTGTSTLVGNGALYANASGTAVLSGPLPVASGGTGVTTSTGTGSVVRANNAFMGYTTVTALWGTGAVSGMTPGAGFGTTGGLRCRADTTNTYNYLQFTTNDGNGQWGLLSCSAAGTLNWNGPLTATTFNGLSVSTTTGTLTIANGATLAVAGAFSGTLTFTGATNVTLPTSGTLATTGVTALTSLAQVGTLTAGTWNATAISTSYGGTGRSGATPFLNELSQPGGAFYSDDGVTFRVGDVLPVAWGGTGTFTSTGTGNVVLSTGPTFNGVTFQNGSSGNGLAAVVVSEAMYSPSSSTPQGATITYYMVNGNRQLFTAALSSNFTLNVTMSSGGHTLDGGLTTQYGVKIELLVTNGATGYYMTAMQIDGNAVTPKWLNGSAPAAGDANAIDLYTFEILKTAAGTFTVLASIQKYA